MGCDIHYVVEEKIGDKWVGLFENNFQQEASERFYRFFGEIAAGVRYESKTSHSIKGWPDDTSDLANHFNERWRDDGHSHSWLTLQEFVEAYYRACEKPFSPEAFSCLSDDNLFGGHDFNDEIDEWHPIANCRVVFFFDN